MRRRAAVVVVAILASCQGQSSSRAFVSIVDPESYPMSPHAWPRGTPIIIECWGGAADRDRAADLVRAKRTATEAFEMGAVGSADVLDDEVLDGLLAEIDILDQWAIAWLTR